MVETNALVPELIVSDIERSLAFYSGRAICDLYERSKFRRKKTDHKVGFFRILVPEGDWESIGLVQCLLGFYPCLNFPYSQSYSHFTEWVVPGLRPCPGL